MIEISEGCNLFFGFERSAVIWFIISSIISSCLIKLFLMEFSIKTGVSFFTAVKISSAFLSLKDGFRITGFSFKNLSKSNSRAPKNPFLVQPNSS